MYANRWKFLRYFICMSVPVRAKILKLGSSWGHLGSSCLVLGKMVKSCWRSESFWRLILEPPKIAKVELWFERELNFRQIRGHFFSLFFCRKNKKNMKIELSFERELNFCGPVPLKKAFHRLALSFVILWILPHPNRIWGGTCGPRRCAQHLIGV